MSKDESKNNPLYGKPWSTHSTHQEYTSAFGTKEILLSEDNLQVKIRRYSNDTFQVKTRVLEAEKTKKQEKSQTKARSKEDKPKTRAQRRAEKMRRKAQQEKK